MSAGCPECAATRAAIGEAWFAGGVSAAEAVRRKTLALEAGGTLDPAHLKVATDAVLYVTMDLTAERNELIALGRGHMRIDQVIDEMRRALEGITPAAHPRAGAVKR